MTLLCAGHQVAERPGAGAPTPTSLRTRIASSVLAGLSDARELDTAGGGVLLGNLLHDSSSGSGAAGTAASQEGCSSRLHCQWRTSLLCCHQHERLTRPQSCQCAGAVNTQAWPICTRILHKHVRRGCTGTECMLDHAAGACCCCVRRRATGDRMRLDRRVVTHPLVVLESNQRIRRISPFWSGQQCRLFIPCVHNHQHQPPSATHPKGQHCSSLAIGHVIHKHHLISHKPAAAHSEGVGQ